jgi:hypothetical protein
MKMNKNYPSTGYFPHHLGCIPRQNAEHSVIMMEVCKSHPLYGGESV